MSTTIGVRKADARLWRWGLVLMSALVVVCYLIAINAYWVGDDYNYVRPKSLADVANFFNPVGRAQYRPLTWLTWASGFALFGTDPLGWHIARLAQHIWNAIWAAYLLRAITGRRDIALLAATIFALHPAQPQTVTWLGGQADASFAMFWLPALWLFVRWRQGVGSDSIKRGRALWLLSGLLGFISMFGKEAAITLPLMSIWIDLLFGRRWPQHAKRETRNAKGESTFRTLFLDHSLFIGISALYVALRLYLFITGQGSLMYGSDQLGFFQHAPDVIVGYVVLSLGFWWLPPDVYAWPFLLKLAILLAAIIVMVLLVRWLGRTALFAVGWIAITLLLTLQAVALRWFYLPALGVGLLVACAWARLHDRPLTSSASSPSSQLRVSRFVFRVSLVLIFLAWFCWQTVAHNEEWRESGEVARGILAQVKALHPVLPRPATFYVANPPYNYKDVLLFNTGLDSAIFHVYNDWTNIRSYSVGEDTAQVQAALADPSKVGPNPVFLRYDTGRMVDYPSLQALIAAGP